MEDEIIGAQLAPGERTLWSGRPYRGPIFRGADVLLIPFGAVWLLALAPSEMLTTLAGGRSPAQLGADVLFGVWLFLGRPLVDLYIRGATTYAVTDQRLIFRIRGPFARLKVREIRLLPALDLFVRADGRGTIRFRQPLRMTSRGPFGWLPGFLDWLLPFLNWSTEFVQIPDAAKVYGIIRDQTNNEMIPMGRAVRFADQ